MSKIILFVFVLLPRKLLKFEKSFFFQLNLYVLQQGPVSMSGENCLFECSRFAIFRCCDNISAYKLTHHKFIIAITIDWSENVIN
jgi:hypothetical protein